MKSTMKFALLAIMFYLALFPEAVNNFQFNKIKPKTTPEKPSNPSDAVYKRIMKNINDLAEDKMKTSDIPAKKRISGSLPEGYPDDMRKAALGTRSDKKNWLPVLGLPTEIYRMCLFPYSNVNYVKWCNNKFSAEKMKNKSCLYNFCEVCCDHLALTYENTAKKNLLGELLKLDQDDGKKAINNVVDRSQIQTCKVKCKEIYPVEMPTPLLEPPRDPLLGSQKRPALSCSDIKKWGPKAAKSGKYWIELPAKGPQEVFCDMETDKGGWTLFFNYIHQPGQEFNHNGNKLPNDTKTNSHLYLHTAGFAPRDVKELRFLCSERVTGQGSKYWHFKTTSKDLIKVAMTSDQTNLNENSLRNAYIELDPPCDRKDTQKCQIAISEEKIGKFHVAGNNPQGGFTSTTFGSTDYDAYWTVKGDDPSQESYECGGSHKGTGFTVPEKNPSMIYTHHSVWFRGNPATIKEASDRYLKNINK